MDRNDLKNWISTQLNSGKNEEYIFQYLNQSGVKSSLISHILEELNKENNQQNNKENNIEHKKNLNSHFSNFVLLSIIYILYLSFIIMVEDLIYRLIILPVIIFIYYISIKFFKIGLYDKTGYILILLSIIFLMITIFLPINYLIFMIPGIFLSMSVILFLQNGFSNFFKYVLYFMGFKFITTVLFMLFSFIISFILILLNYIYLGYILVIITITVTVSSFLSLKVINKIYENKYNEKLIQELVVNLIAILIFFLLLFVMLSLLLIYYQNQQDNYSTSLNMLESEVLRNSLNYQAQIFFDDLGYDSFESIPFGLQYPLNLFLSENLNLENLEIEIIYICDLNWTCEEENPIEIGEVSLYDTISYVTKTDDKTLEIYLINIDPKTFNSYYIFINSENLKISNSMNFLYNSEIYESLNLLRTDFFKKLNYQNSKITDKKSNFEIILDYFNSKNTILTTDLLHNITLLYLYESEISNLQHTLIINQTNIIDFYNTENQKQLEILQTLSQINENSDELLSNPTLNTRHSDFNIIDFFNEFIEKYYFSNYYGNYKVDDLNRLFYDKKIISDYNEDLQEPISIFVNILIHS